MPGGVQRDQLISTVRPKDLALYIASYAEQGGYTANLAAARTALALRRTGRIQEAMSTYNNILYTAALGAFDAGIMPLVYVDGGKEITPFASDSPAAGTVTFGSALSGTPSVKCDLERPVRGLSSYAPAHRMPNEINQLFAWGSASPVEKEIRAGDEEIRGTAECAWDFDPNRTRYPGREIFIALFGSEFPLTMDVDFKIGKPSNPFAVLAVYYRPNPVTNGVAQVEDLMIGCALTSPPPQWPQAGRGESGKLTIEWDATDRIIKFIPQS
jgi:hypothetical protein